MDFEKEFTKLIFKTFGGYYEIRERVILDGISPKFNNKIVIYIDNATADREYRPHAHILVNRNRSARIWLDTLYVEPFDSKKDVKILQEYLLEHKEKFFEVWNRNNKNIQILC